MSVSYFCASGSSDKTAPFPFIGRDRELGEIRSLLEQTRTGRGLAVAVTGEPGIGKTRLCEEALSAARSAGFLVCSTFGHRILSAVPMALVSGLVRSALDQLSAGERASICSGLPGLESITSAGQAPYGQGFGEAAVTLAEPRLAAYGDVDTSAVTLRLASGALVQIDCTRRIGYGYDERIEVLGSTGMAEARRHRNGNVSRYAAGKVTDDGLHPGWFERVKPTYAAALAAFVKALEDGTPMSPSLEDGLKAQAIAEAATRSLTSGRAEPISY